MNFTFSPRYLGLLVCFILAAVCFLPYILSFNFVEDGYVCTDDRTGPIFYPKLHELNSAILAISAFMVYEAILDLFTKLPLDVWLPRILMNFSMLISTILFNVLSNDSSEDKLRLFVSVSYLRVFGIGGCLIFHILGKYAPHTNTLSVPWQILLYAWFMGSAVLYSWGPYINQEYVSIPILVTFVITSITLLYTFVWGILKYWPFCRVHREQLTGKQLYTVVNFAVLFLYVFTLVAIAGSYGNKPWCGVVANELVAYPCVDIIAAAIIHTIPYKMAQYDSEVAKFMLNQKKMYVRYVSHEIRTPLNVTYLGLQLLLDEIDSYSRATIAECKEACNAAIEILNDLLLYDKIEDGTMHLDCSKFTIRSFLLKYIAMFRLQAREGGVQLEYESAENIPLNLNVVISFADEKKLSQVVRNLVSNAIKFTPNGGSVKILASFEPDLPEGRNGHVTVRVIDTGCGISKENQSKLFHQVIQFNAQRLQKGGGSGLGLWIANKIIEKHNGTIGVESQGEDGSGSTFYFTVPAQVLSDTDIMTATETGASVEETRLLQPSIELLPRSSKIQRFSRALVVDDAISSRKIFCRALAKYFDHIFEASNGREAVAKVEEAMADGRTFDYIFMDQVMPCMSGNEATVAIRKMKYDGPIIAVSGNAMEDDIALMLSSGADAYVVKPVDIAEIGRLLCVRNGSRLSEHDMPVSSERYEIGMTRCTSSIHPDG